jgi:hypothetical protein
MPMPDSATEMRELPPPKRGAGNKNLKQKTVIEPPKRRPGRPSKGLVQLSAKVPAQALEAFTDAHKAAKRGRKAYTVGDFFSDVVAAFTGGERPAPADQDAKPSIADVAARRTVACMVWMQPKLLEVYREQASHRGSIGACVEHAAVQAARCAALEAELADARETIARLEAKGRG